MIVYRGYNKDYPNFGVRPEQNHIWTTNDIDYALEYAKSFDNGGIVEFDIDESLLEIANEYDCEELFEDWDEFGGMIDADNEMCQTLLDMGYNCIYLDNSGIDCFLILDKDLIKSSKDIPLDIDEMSINEEINHILKLSGVQLNEEMDWTQFRYRFKRNFIGNVHKNLLDLDSYIFIKDKNGMSYKITPSGTILCQKENGNWQKCLSKFKTFDEIYNYFVEKNILEG